MLMGHIAPASASVNTASIAACSTCAPGRVSVQATEWMRWRIPASISAW